MTLAITFNSINASSRQTFPCTKHARVTPISSTETKTQQHHRSCDFLSPNFDIFERKRPTAKRAETPKETDLPRRRGAFGATDFHRADCADTADHKCQLGRSWSFRPVRKYVQVRVLLFSVSRLRLGDKLIQCLTSYTFLGPNQKEATKTKPTSIFFQTWDIGRVQVPKSASSSA